MTPAEDEDMIEAFPTDGADPALRERVRPRGADGRLHYREAFGPLAEFRGSSDLDRAFGDWPKGIDGLIDVVSMDPATSTGHCGILHWAIDPKSRITWVVAGWRPQMTGSDFIDTVELGAGTVGIKGLLPDLMASSTKLDHRIRCFIEHVACAGSPALPMTDRAGKASGNRRRRPVKGLTADSIGARAAGVKPTTRWFISSIV